MSRRTATCILMGIALSATVVVVASRPSRGPCRGCLMVIPTSRACGPTTA